MRRVGIAVALVAAACGTTTPPAQHTAWSDQPKHDVPYSQDTPESFAVPTPTTTARPTRHRASRSAARPRQTEATPAPTGDVWQALARCESGMRQDATSPNGLYLSYFQWSFPTWRSVGGVGDPRTVGYDTQAALAQRLQARSGWGQWPRCSRKLGLR